MSLQDKLQTVNQDNINELAELSIKMRNMAREKPTLSVSKFEKYLLPYIIGELERNEFNDMAYVHNYLEVSNGYRTPIAVVDKKGELVYTLPPIILDANIDGVENMNFNLIIKKFNAVSENNFVAASRTLSKELKVAKENISVEEEVHAGYIAELQKIYTDYSDRLSSKARAATGDAEEDDDDFMDYD